AVGPDFGGGLRHRSVYGGELGRVGRGHRPGRTVGAHGVGGVEGRGPASAPGRRRLRQQRPAGRRGGGGSTRTPQPGLGVVPRVADGEEELPPDPGPVSVARRRARARTGQAPDWTERLAAPTSCWSHQHLYSEVRVSQYIATVAWQRQGATFTDNRYSRAHVWRFDGGAEVPASSSPQVVPLPYSDAAGVDPEEAFVAALSSCHML